MTRPGSLDQARAVADALLYEGYLLYPYRATSSKNRVRWQFGVLGPPGAAEAGTGEESTMAVDCLLRAGPDATVTVRVRCLQLQTRVVEAFDAGGYRRVDELVSGDARWLTWDEAVGAEQVLAPLRLADLGVATRLDVSVPGGRGVEPLTDADGWPVGRLVRERCDLTAVLDVHTTPLDGLVRLSLQLANTHREETTALGQHRGHDRDGAGKAAAIAYSLIGTHLLVEVEDGAFVSTADPPAGAHAAAGSCTQRRWWPVLAGPRDEDSLLLVSPIIVADHAELAPESAGALFDSTEIDEILTLRVMTMTDEEKADARATDRRAAEIIDRCDAMTPEQLQDLHGALRDPRATLSVTSGSVDPYALPDDLAWATPPDPADGQVFTTEVPWWDPAADASVAPDTDAVTIAGVRVSKGSLVTVRPNRRADAQDIFFAGMRAKVAAVLSDVDGETHVAVTLVDDPAAELHDWYGRYHYFAPDELVPVGTVPAASAGTPSTEGDAP